MMNVGTGLIFLMLAPAQGSEPPEKPAIESGYLDAVDGRLFYDAAGRGDVIVLIHDGLVHREAWENNFPLFAVEDLHTVLTSLKVARATLIGCSMGGLLSIEYTLTHPEMVSGLVLVGPIVSGYGFSEHFRTRGGRGMPGPDPWLMAPGSLAARRRVKELLTANPRNLTVPYNLLRGPKEKAAGQLSRIKIPTLIIVGEQDIPDVQAHTGVIEAGIPAARRVVLANAGHLAHMEVPEEFNRIVVEFLAGIKP